MRADLNHLSAEVQFLIGNGENVVEEAKNMMKDQNYYLDLTSKWQLKSDYKEVEKYIKLIENGKQNDKNKKELELAIIRLRTTIDGLTKFYTR